MLMPTTVTGIFQLNVRITAFDCTNISVFCEISGFRRDANEVFAVLVHYTAFIASYRRFGTAYRPLKIVPIGCRDTLVHNRVKAA
jgi:hypothetical protein